MKKKTFTNKEVLIIALIAIALYILSFVLPLLFIVGIYLIIKLRKKPRIEPQQKKKPLSEATVNLEAIRATYEECEKLVEQDRQIRLETDLRQFQGRTDVTKEELATYMFEQRRWDGKYERHIQMEEIIKVCNLDSDDIEWVENELNYYHSENGNILIDKCSPIRSEEEKAVWMYHNEQGKNRVNKYLDTIKRERKQEIEYLKLIGEFDPDYEKYFDNSYEKAVQVGMNNLREYDYDRWLKIKGYVK